MDAQEDILSRVQRVETPPFLYTRILQRIKAVQETPVSIRFRLAFGAVALLIILLNIGTFFNNNRPGNRPIPSNTMSPYITVQNDIYHD